MRQPLFFFYPDQMYIPVSNLDYGDIHNLLAARFILNRSPVNEEVKIVQSYITYDEVGNMTSTNVWDEENNKWVKTEFSYDEYGNLIRIKDPYNTCTVFEYGDEFKKAYPTKVIKGVDENGISKLKDPLGEVIEPVCEWMGYNFDTGQKILEIDGEGYLTEYTYDYLNRLVVIRYPDEDDVLEVSGWNYRSELAPSDYLNRGNNPVKIQYYDDENNRTVVANAESIFIGAQNDNPLKTLQSEDFSASLLVKVEKTGYELANKDILINNFIEKPIFNKAIYYYDGLGRLEKVHQIWANPGEADPTPYETRFIYDSYGNLVEVRDAEGRVTLKEYDGNGRVVAIYYPMEGKKTERTDSYPYKTTIKYEDWCNHRVITDAEGNVIHEYKDWLGNVINIVRESKEESLSYTGYYDQMNNLVRIVTPNGITDQLYNSRNQLIKKWLPEVEVLKPGFNNVTSLRPEITFEYDLLGNKIKEVSPNGNDEDIALKYGDFANDYHYDALGRLIREEGPEGEEILNFYDRKGQLVKKMVKVRDALSDENPDYPHIINDSYYRITEKVYHPRGWVKAEIQWDNDNSYITYQDYNIIGQEISVTGPMGVIKASDPRVDPSWKQVEIKGELYALSPYYTVVTEYDNLGRKVTVTNQKIERLKLPSTGSFTESEVDLSEQSRIRYTYDRVGNLKTESLYRVDDSSETLIFTKSYEYTPQNWLKEERLNGVLLRRYEYDRVGNKRYVYEVLEENSEEIVTEYKYDGFGRVKEIINPDGSKIIRHYDALDNLIYEFNATEFSVMEWEFDNLGRLIRVDEPDVLEDTYYYYDPDGNLVKKRLSNGYEINYSYDQSGRLLQESRMVNQEKLVNYYGYYLDGSLKYEINPRGVKEEYKYNNRGLIERVSYFDYQGDFWNIYGNGINNLDIEQDVNWIEREWDIYDYTPTGNLKSSATYRSIIGPDGNEIFKKISKTRILYNSANQIISLTKEIEGEKEYTINYRYDAAGNVTGIRYPYSRHWLEYVYDKDNRLRSIPGFVDGGTEKTGFEYDNLGRLTDVRYANGVNTHYVLDEMGRTEEIQVTGFELDPAYNIKETSLNYTYTYDGAGNVRTRNQNSYEYDKLDRLTKADIFGLFYDQTYFNIGHTPDDILTDKPINFTLEETEKVIFDYASGSIGIELKEIEEGIGRIVLLNEAAIPGIDPLSNRIKKRTVQILTSDDNKAYTLIPEEKWEMEKDPGGNLIFTFNENIKAKYIKVHSNFDDRNRAGAFDDLSEFKNIAKELVLVYKRLDKITIEYGYDSVGNREWKKVIKNRESRTGYSYYPAEGNIRSNRLLEAKTVFDGSKVTESYAYSYDRAGNMIAKGNFYEIRDTLSGQILSDNDSLNSVGDPGTGVEVVYTETEGIYVEYWEYDYNLRNRLKEVRKNGQTVAQYLYDSSGKRIKSIENGRTIYYVYGLDGKLIYEDEVLADTDTEISGGKNIIGGYTDGIYSDHGFKDTIPGGTKSYIIAFGQTIAEVEGNLGYGGEINYYHHDNLGSTTAITNFSGKVVMRQDYLPFGEDLYDVVKPLAEHGTGIRYTGQIKDISTGLYYYNARWYDPEIGRFTREDDYKGKLLEPQEQNYYLYVVNNPLKYKDPSGYYKVNKVETNHLLVEITKGDTLKTILEEIYWSTGKQTDIIVDVVAKLNQIDNLDSLKVGDQIILPIKSVEINNEKRGFPTNEIITSLWTKGKIDTDQYYDYLEAIGKSVYDDELMFKNWVDFSSETPILIVDEFHGDITHEEIFDLPTGIKAEAELLKLNLIWKDAIIYTETSLVGGNALIGYDRGNIGVTDDAVGISAKGYMYKVEGGFKILETPKYIIYLTGELTAGSIGIEAKISLSGSKIGLHLLGGATVGWKTIPKSVLLRYKEKNEYHNGIK